MFRCTIFYCKYTFVVYFLLYSFWLKNKSLLFFRKLTSAVKAILDFICMVIYHQYRYMLTVCTTQLQDYFQKRNRNLNKRHAMRANNTLFRIRLHTSFPILCGAISCGCIEQTLPLQSHR